MVNTLPTNSKSELVGQLLHFLQQLRIMQKMHNPPKKEQLVALVTQPLK